MNKLAFLFVLIYFSVVISQTPPLAVVISHTPPLLWDQVVYLGQPSATSRTAGLSQRGLNQPPSLAIVSNTLIVSDYTNARVLSYNLSNIQTYANATSVLNAPNFDTKGSFSSNGLETYTQNGNSYVWIGTVAPGQKDNVVRFSLPFSPNQIPDNLAFTGLTLSFPQAVRVDVQNQLLYVVDSGNNRVLQYSMSNLATPLRIYGQSSLLNTRANQGASGANSSSLYSPTKVAIGCNGEIFIADARNNRILRFPNSATTANLVIGQASFTLNAASSTTTGLNTPYSIALNSDCSSLWVADTFNNRILRYDAPFTSNPTPAGVLGDPSSQGPASDRFRPYDIDYDTMTGRLWIADYNNNRVLGGITNNAPSQSSTSAPSLSSTSAPSQSSTSTASLSSTSAPSQSSTSTASLSSTSTASLSSTSTASLSSTSAPSQSSLPQTLSFTLAVDNSGIVDLNGNNFFGESLCPNNQIDSNSPRCNWRTPETYTALATPNSVLSFIAANAGSNDSPLQGGSNPAAVMYQLQIGSTVCDPFVPWLCIDDIISQSLYGTSSPPPNWTAPRFDHSDWILGTLDDLGYNGPDAWANLTSVSRNSVWYAANGVEQGLPSSSHWQWFRTNSPNTVIYCTTRLDGLACPTLGSL